MHIEDIIELRRGEKAWIVIKLQMPIGQSNLVGALKEGCSFETSDLMVKEYCGSKRLSTAKKCSTKEIDDIGHLSTDATQCYIRMIQNLHIFAVDKLEMYNSCVKCRGKVDLEDDDGIGELANVEPCNL